MASINSRARADGGTRYQVRWKEGARVGSFQAETFTTEAGALAFKADVEAAGNRWPVGWIRGKDYLDTTAPDPVRSRGLLAGPAR